jgi:hypothetical protein
MIEIGKKIAKQEYDVYLLEELWMKPDHATIKSFVPEGEASTAVSVMHLIRSVAYKGLPLGLSKVSVSIALFWTRIHYKGETPVIN